MHTHTRFAFLSDFCNPNLDKKQNKTTATTTGSYSFNSCNQLPPSHSLTHIKAQYQYQGHVWSTVHTKELAAVWRRGEVNHWCGSWEEKRWWRERRGGEWSGGEEGRWSGVGGRVEGRGNREGEKKEGKWRGERGGRKEKRWREGEERRQEASVQVNRLSI